MQRQESMISALQHCTTVCTDMNQSQVTPCLEFGEEHLDDIMGSNGGGETEVCGTTLWWSEQSLLQGERERPHHSKSIIIIIIHTIYIILHRFVLSMKRK